MRAHDRLMGVFRVVLICGILVGIRAGMAAGDACAEGLESGPRLMGMRGLNTVPDARMDPPGTIRAGLGVSDPYLHASVSAQLAGPLSLNLRQSARMSGLLDTPRALSPAVDIKVRLLEEGPWRPAVAVGLDSAFGERATASEYIALSKRYGDFDFTAGLGWGRLGSAGHMGNPLAFASRERSMDDSRSNGPGDWFTGKDAAFSAGIAYVPYFAPGVSFKLDWKGDTYAAEKASDPGFDPPAPWSASLNWERRGIGLGIGTAGGEKIMARLNLTASPDTWGVAPYKRSLPPPLPARPEKSTTTAMAQTAGENGIFLHSIAPDPEGRTLSAVMDSDAFEPMPRRIGRAARSMAAYAGARVESLVLTPEEGGLRGMSVRLSRHDLERAVQGSGSPEEIWKNAEITRPVDGPMSSGKMKDFRKAGGFRWILQTDLGLAERSAGILHRTALIADFQQKQGFKFLTSGGRLRLNLFGNTGDLPVRTSSGTDLVRGHLGAFSGLRVMPEVLYFSASHSFAGEVHASLTMGYLEEMAAGTGAEILWRPFGKRFALGAEVWSASLRDPETPGAIGLSGAPVLSGHLNGWYEWPEDDLTLYAKAGRYRGGDWGGTIGLIRDFSNVVRLDAAATVTDGADRDEDGWRMPVGLAMLSLRVPIGNIPTRFVPQGSEIHLNVGPQGRNAGQILTNPAPLYERTNGFSTGRLAEGWGRVTE